MTISFSTLTQLIRAGKAPPRDVLFETLAASGRTAEDLLGAIAKRGPRSGDPCEMCGGKVTVIDSREVAGSRVRRLGCRSCGWRPEGGKVVSSST